MTTRQTLYFARPYCVEVRREPWPQVAPHQVLVQTVLSAISAGTEMLFYRGQVPAGMAMDTTITGMDSDVQYPLSYGYACAGDVIATGTSVDPGWRGRRVFAFHPHSSAFVAEPASLLPIPDALSYEQAVLLSNMETAVNFVMDAQPLLGERVLLLGLGVVGLLTLYLLCQFPLSELVAVDGYAKRRRVAHGWGAHSLFSPDQMDALAGFDPDLIFEVSSNPAALSNAIQLAGFGTRIVIGSWYGDKVAHLPLGGPFHRNRVRLIGSQVSTVDGQFGNRWSKARRLESAWSRLHALPVNDLITHRLPIAEGDRAYQLLDQDASNVLQILLTY